MRAPTRIGRIQVSCLIVNNYESMTVKKRAWRVTSHFAGKKKNVLERLTFIFGVYLKKTVRASLYVEHYVGEMK